MQFLYENQNIPPSLTQTIRDTPSLHPYFENNFRGIKPKNYCGFLLIEGESYFIIPKIIKKENSDTENLNIFIYMLIYANGIKLKHEDIMHGQMEEHHMLELFIRLFSDALLDEFKKGVFKQYITLQENLKVLRGKYIIEKNFDNFYHQNIYCEFDEFSMDNTLNQFFLYAIRVFKRFSNYNNLHRCEAVLDEVVYQNIDLKRAEILFDRMNSRYQKSYEVAMMILQKLIPMTENSQDKSFAFLFKMSDVFEGFIGKLYEKIDSSTQLQYTQSFEKLHLRPDIYTDSEIIDMKYKSFDAKKLTRDDKYQMFVYGRNFKKSTMIIYPKHHNVVDETIKLGEGDEMVNLRMRSLDLNFSGRYDGFIEEMIRRVEEIR